MAPEDGSDGVKDAVADEGVDAGPVLGALGRFQVEGGLFFRHYVCVYICAVGVVAGYGGRESGGELTARDSM